MDNKLSNSVTSVGLLRDILSNLNLDPTEDQIKDVHKEVNGEIEKMMQIITKQCVVMDELCSAFPELKSNRDYVYEICKKYNWATDSEDMINEIITFHEGAEKKSTRRKKKR